MVNVKCCQVWGLVEGVDFPGVGLSCLNSDRWLEPSILSVWRDPATEREMLTDLD